MRIGISTFALSSRLGMAGPGRYILELVRALARVEHGPDLILFGNADNLPLLPSEGCRQVDCGWVTTKRPLRLVWEQLVLPMLTKRHHIDLLHSPVFVAPLCLPCASVVTVHDMTWFTIPKLHIRSKGAYFRAMVPQSVRHAARAIAVSEASKRDLVALLGTSPEKVAVTYEGVDLGFFRPVAADEVGRIEAGYSIQRPYVLYVGKLEPRKNVPVLIQSFGAIASHFPQHQLVIVGSPGWDYQAIYDTAARSPCQERLRFTGFVPESDLPALYSGADLFVYPSSYEGFGLPVLEAMACGVPVITTNASSLPEVAGDAGLLVDPQDPIQLAEAMCHALRDEQLRHRLRARGLERVRQFTWEETARRTLQVYEEACSLARGRSLGGTDE